MADIRRMTVHVQGMEVPVDVDVDKLRQGAPRGLVFGTPEFHLWLYETVRYQVETHMLRQVEINDHRQREWKEHLRQQEEAQRAQQVKREANRLCQYVGQYGECNTPGSDRHAADGAILGRYCMYHFRKQHPDLAPPKGSARDILHSASERAGIAYRLRHEERKKWKDVGAALGVSGPRASQLASEFERYERRKARLLRQEQEYVRECPSDPFAALSSRVRNCLKRGLRGDGIELNVDVVQAVPDDDLMAMRNFGRAALSEVRAAFGPYQPTPSCNWVGEGVA